MKYTMHLNNINNEDCPCNVNNGKCPRRFARCHSECMDYIDWQQLHAVKVQNVREQQGQSIAYYEGIKRRKKS